jgi:hypothetical protein
MRYAFLVVMVLVAVAGAVRPAAAQSVIGRVVSEVDRAPLAGVQVQLLDDEGAVHREVVTDSAGDFRVRAAVPGVYRLRASVLGHATVTSEPLRFELGGVTQVEIVMGTEAVVLEPVRVVAESSARMGPLREFYDRAERGVRAGVGRIFTRLDLETGGYTEMRHVLLMAPVRSGCPMSYFIDGMPASANELDGINIDQVEGVEIYSGPASVPPEYQRRVSCGATLVWMRRDMPGRPFSWTRMAGAAAVAVASFLLLNTLAGR